MQKMKIKSCRYYKGDSPREFSNFAFKGLLGRKDKDIHN